MAMHRAFIMGGRHGREERRVVKIDAPDISNAIRMLHERLPELRDVDIRFVDEDDIRMGYEFSEETGEHIYFKPGCPCGYRDCILDPMRDVAKSCRHQSDMTDDKWMGCSKLDFRHDGCCNYDDECK